TTPATTATRAPTTTAIGSEPSASSTTQPTTGALPTVRPGAFCAPEGAVGTYRGRTYVCSTTSATGTPYVNGAKRWRQQN
ncbi:MAG: hypothetical protein ACO37V_09295, partial [Ilumatobacteraceae bacterium]